MRRRICFAILVVTVLAVGMGSPALRWRLVGWYKNEQMWRGRPSSYWAKAIAVGYSSEAIAPRGGVVGTLRNHLIVNPYVEGFLRLGRDVDVDAIPMLVELLQKEEFELIRPFVPRFLAALGPSGAPAVPVLIEALQDEDPMVRREAIEALGEIGPGARLALPALCDMLFTEWREEAAQALADMGPAAHSAIPGLFEALQLEDCDTWSHQSLAYALWRILFSTSPASGS